MQILAAARGIGADLVVAGSRHLGWLERQLSAPTSEELLRLTTVPLLVVRDEPGTWPPARVLVGIDQRAAAIEEEAGTRLWGSFRFQRSPTAGLEEVAKHAGSPVLLVVGHRSARRRTAESSPSVAGGLLQDGRASVLICPSGALAAIRRRRGVRVTGVRR